MKYKNKKDIRKSWKIMKELIDKRQETSSIMKLIHLTKKKKKKIVYISYFLYFLIFFNNFFMNVGIELALEMPDSLVIFD